MLVAQAVGEAAEAARALAAVMDRDPDELGTPAHRGMRTCSYAMLSTMHPRDRAQMTIPEHDKFLRRSHLIDSTCTPSGAMAQ